MARHFLHQHGQPAQGSVCRQGVQGDPCDCEAAKDQNYNLDDVSKRYRFQSAIKRIKRCKARQCGHRGHHAPTGQRGYRETSQPQHSGEVHCCIESNPKDTHQRFDAVAIPLIKELRHSVNLAFQENRQEVFGDNY